VTFIFDARASDSPLVDEIWRARSEHAGSFVSVAASHWEIVVTRHVGRQTMLTVRGPQTMTTPLSYPAGGEWCAIRLPLSVVMPSLPLSSLVDRALDLPDASSQSFWLDGSAWPFPEYENADVFIDRLVRDGLLVRNPVVEAALQCQPINVSPRTVQRHVLKATGLTQGTIRQVNRARHAMSLLQRGVSILDTVYEAGYYDQPHLTRSLQRWLGQTPTQIATLDQGR
jgi:AraC-like DNA-binding protein